MLVQPILSQNSLGDVPFITGTLTIHHFTEFIAFQVSSDAKQRVKLTNLRLGLGIFMINWMRDKV